MFDKLTSKEAKNFISSVQQPFSSLPHLPQGLIDFAVGIVPIASLIVAVLLAIVGLTQIAGGLGLLAFSPVSGLVVLVSAALSFVSAMLLFQAQKLLKEKSLVGWTYLFWVQIASGVQALLSIITVDGRGIVMSLIGFAFGLYVVFEMKKEYS
jgi:hypothetical protein